MTSQLEFTCMGLPLDGFAPAEFSPDRRYRYILTRRWSPAPMLGCIGLNPSTADELQDDPTVRRWMGFARRDGFGGIVVGNLFAFRATNPRVMCAARTRSVMATTARSSVSPRCALRR